MALIDECLKRPDVIEIARQALRREVSRFLSKQPINFTAEEMHAIMSCAMVGIDALDARKDEGKSKTR